MQTNISEFNRDEIASTILTNRKLSDQDPTLHPPSDPNPQPIKEEIRESKLPPLLPLKNVKVNFPKTKTTTLLSFYSFEIDFEWEGQHLSVNRRFSNVELLIAAIHILLPFTYVPPAHFKKLQIIDDKRFLELRTEQLNRFFKYIEMNDKQFNISWLISPVL